MEIPTSPDKMFYTIGEAAEMFQVNVSLIRYWENEFKILKPKRNKKGNRLFTPKDIDHLHLIYHLVKECGMTLDGAKKRLDTNWDESLRKFEIIKKLKNIRKQLEVLNDSILVIEKTSNNSL